MTQKKTFSHPHLLLLQLGVASQGGKPLLTCSDLASSPTVPSSNQVQGTKASTLLPSFSVPFSADFIVAASTQLLHLSPDPFSPHPCGPSSGEASSCPATG
ncbi:unnamed protein product [Linum tenue]|uniref:Uncharacterized protein n=1 Tax=Linum tenue TaxID=586396 RepID=A0AAV0LYE6_9ROSI|nr:unnamed protein product [Linum tenue]